MQRVLARRGAEVLRRHLPRPVRACDVADAAEGDDRWYGVSTGRGIAQVPANAGPALDLDSAYQRSGVNQTGIRRRDGRVLVDLVTGHGGAKIQAGPCRVAHAVELRDVLDIDNHIGQPATGAHHYQNVGAAGDNPGPVAMFVQYRNSFVDTLRSYEIKCFQIAHLLRREL